MSMSALVRALGAAAGGVSKGMDEAEAAAERKRIREQAAEDRAFTMSERARTTAERDRADKLRVDMGAASAPVNVEQVQPAGPVMDGAEGAAGQAIPMVSRVQGKSFETPDAAAAAAAAANTPQAMASRQAQVASSAGNPHLAQQLRTGAMQEQVAKYTLNAAERAELDARFNADLQANVNSWESFDKFTSESAADGQGGKLKLKSVPTPDGKNMVVNVVLPDGTLKPTERVFPNSADGLALATAELARMPAEKKLTHLHHKAVLAQQTARDEDAAKRRLEMLGETARHNREMERLAAQRASAAAAAKASAAGMTMADLEDGHKSIARTLSADWKTLIDGAIDPAKLKAIKVSRESEIATVQRLYTGAMSAGFALTPEQAIVAFRSGESASQSFKSKDGKGTVKVDGVMYGGRFIPLADNPGAAPGAKPAAPTKPAAAASAAAPAPAIPVDPNGPQAPAALPEQPSMVAQAAAAAGKTVKKVARAADGREWKNLAAGR